MVNASSCATDTRSAKGLHSKLKVMLESASQRFGYSSWTNCVSKPGCSLSESQHFKQYGHAGVVGVGDGDKAVAWPQHNLHSLRCLVMWQSGAWHLRSELLR